MMAQLLLIQAAAPLALLAWLAFAPLRGKLALAVQALATGLFIAAVAEAGVWLFPPWWTGYALLALWLLAALLAARKRRRQPPRAGGRADVFAALALFGLGAYAAFVFAQAATARTPAADVVDLSFPLRGDRYYVTSGGSNETMNAHVRTLHPATERMARFRGQSYGLDVIQLDAWGLRTRGGVQPADPSRYAIFGEPIFAPCSGEALHAEDGHPDLPVPEADLENLPGNHVLLRCGGVAVLLAHMRRGSVAVHPGQPVTEGDRLGAVGNSGNTGEPHLHVHAQRLGRAAAPLSGEPIQARFGRRLLVRNDRFRAEGDGVSLRRP